MYKALEVEFIVSKQMLLMINGDNACYVGETCQHFSTRVREHLVSDRASHVFKASARFCTLSRFVFSGKLPCFESRFYRFSTQDKRGYSYSKRTTILESTIKPCKSKTILLILTLSYSTSFLVVIIYHN